MWEDASILGAKGFVCKMKRVKKVSLLIGYIAKIPKNLTWRID
jgi:hypothetical protein